LNALYGEVEEEGTVADLAGLVLPAEVVDTDESFTEEDMPATGGIEWRGGSCGV